MYGGDTESGLWWLVSIAGMVASVVSLTICACCRKKNGFEHKASIIRTSSRRPDEETREAPEKETANVERWDCLIDIDRSRKNKQETARQTRSLYITDQTKKEPSSPTFNFTKKRSSYYDYQKFDSPSNPHTKLSTPPSSFDHYDGRMTPTQLQQQRQSIDSGVTEHTSISALSTNNRNTKKVTSEQHRFSPPPIFEGRREETPLDIEVYTPPPIPPRNYLFLENDDPEDEPVVLQSGRSSIKEQYSKYRYSLQSSATNTPRYHDQLPGFKIFRPDNDAKYNAQNCSSNGIAVRYSGNQHQHVIHRPPAIRVDPDYQRHLHGIDNLGYVRYSDDVGPRSHELGEEGFVRLRRHPDEIYRSSYENNRRRMENRYSMDFDRYRAPLLRSPYDQPDRNDRRQRFSSFVSQDYDDMGWQMEDRMRREIPVFRESDRKANSIPTPTTAIPPEIKLEAPIPKPRLLRRSTVGDITSQGEKRKHALPSNDKNTNVPKPSNETDKELLRLKIYKELKEESPKKLDNLEVIIDKILDVINQPPDRGKELKNEVKEVNQEDSRTQKQEKNDAEYLRQRSSSLPGTPLDDYPPLANQLEAQTKYHNSGESSDNMLKRFKGGIEEKSDQKRRKRGGSGRVKKSSNKSEKKSSPPEVVKVTVLPVVQNSCDILTRLEEQNNRDIQSLEKLQIENDKKLSRSHGDIFQDVEMLSVESPEIKTNSNLELSTGNLRSKSPTFQNRSVPPIPQRTNVSFPNIRFNKNRQTGNSGTSMRVRSATPPVATDTTSSKKHDRSTKRFSVHGTALFSSPRSPNLTTGRKQKLKESKSTEGKLSSGSMRRISRTGEIVRIPAEDEYSIPFDCISHPGSGMASPTYSIPMSDVDRPPHSPSNNSSGLSGSNWSVNGMLTPRTPESGRFNFGSRELRGISESGFINSDNDDYDYADPIN